MADAVNKQILDALATLIGNISGIKGVTKGYLDASAVAGKPWVCFYATDEQAEGRGLETLRRKVWDMTVGCVGYVAGQEPFDLGYLWMQKIENALELDPTIGIGNVQHVRVFARRVTPLGMDDEGIGTRLEARFDMLIAVRYRYVAGSL